MRGVCACLQETYGDRDATLLKSQLEPLSTPTLRARLAHCFDTPTDPAASDRPAVMELLLAAYAAEGAAGRMEREVAGLVVPAGLAAELLAVLRQTDWVSLPRERPTVKADGYLILRRPPAEPAKTAAGRKEAEKLKSHGALWRLAVDAIEQADSVYAGGFSAIAVSKGFVGSPHVDGCAQSRPSSTIGSRRVMMIARPRSCLATTWPRSTRCRSEILSAAGSASSAARGTSRLWTPRGGWRRSMAAFRTGSVRTSASGTR